MAATTMDDSDWWVAEDGDEAVAYAGLYTGIKGEGWLVRAGVVPAARGNNLQRRLIGVRVARAKVLGIPKLYTYTMDWNRYSNANLARAGFVPYKVDGKSIYWYRRTDK